MRRPSLVSRFWFGLLVLAASTVSQSALATPTFPGVVRDYLNLGCTPQCIICHHTNEGGIDINDFGDLMLRNGAVPYDDDTVRNALRIIEQGADCGAMPVPAACGHGGTAMTTPGSLDTDHDGVDDITELRNGDLPATPGPAGQGLACSAVRYGCGARIAPEPPAGHTGAAVLGITLLWVGARARRRLRGSR
ncbi:MAG TPA: hypothetical protein VGM29_09215 [Polyangiaceae bacterium]